MIGLAEVADFDGCLALRHRTADVGDSEGAAQVVREVAVGFLGRNLYVAIARLVAVLIERNLARAVVDRDCSWVRRVLPCSFQVEYTTAVGLDFRLRLSEVAEEVGHVEREVDSLNLFVSAVVFRYFNDGVGRHEGCHVATPISVGLLQDSGRIACGLRHGERDLHVLRSTCECDARSCLDGRGVITRTEGGTSCNSQDEALVRCVARERGLSVCAVPYLIADLGEEVARVQLDHVDDFVELARAEVEGLRTLRPRQGGEVDSSSLCVNKVVGAERHVEGRASHGHLPAEIARPLLGSAIDGRFGHHAGLLADVGSRTGILQRDSTCGAVNLEDVGVGAGLELIDGGEAVELLGEVVNLLRSGVAAGEVDWRLICSCFVPLPCGKPASGSSVNDFVLSVVVSQIGVGDGSVLHLYARERDVLTVRDEVVRHDVGVVFLGRRFACLFVLDGLFGLHVECECPI